MQLNDLYQQLILDHYKNPHGAGLREPYDVEVKHFNPTCGDEITLRVRLQGSEIADISYEAQGCSISVAAASVMAETVTTRAIDDSFGAYTAFLEMLQTRDGSEPDVDVLGDGVAFAGVAKFPARVKCALLGWAAMKDAVSQALSLRELDPDNSTPDSKESV